MKYVNWSRWPWPSWCRCVICVSTSTGSIRFHQRRFLIWMSWKFCKFWWSAPSWSLVAQSGLHLTAALITFLFCGWFLTGIWASIKSREFDRQRFLIWLHWWCCKYNPIWPTLVGASLSAADFLCSLAECWTTTILNWSMTAPSTGWFRWKSCNRPDLLLLIPISSLVE